MYCFIPKGGKSRILVKIGLQRFLLQYIFNIYLPMLSLLIIVLLTLFFDESQLQFAIGLVLTVMLM